METRARFPFKKLVVLTSFAIGMAFVETTIVVYLRALYYPEGFSFPMKFIPLNHYFIEVSREVATIIMLVAVGWLSGKRFTTRFAGFIMAFGIWDIFYYIFLKITLNWPASLLDWDVLFLIPIAWIGPVLAPVLVSLALIGAGIVIWSFDAQGLEFHFPLWGWILEIIAGLIIIVSFLTNTWVLLEQTVPENFAWWLFFAGLVPGMIIFAATVKMNLVKRNAR